MGFSGRAKGDGQLGWRSGGEGGDRFLVLVVVEREGKGVAKISPSVSEGKGPTGGEKWIN